MTAITLSGVPVTKLRLTVGAWGLWWAEVETQFAEGALAALPPGSAALAVSDLAWTGTIVAGDELDGIGRWHIVGGKGGWSTEVPGLGYYSGGGVSAAIVLADLAALTGEAAVYDGAPPTLGSHFARGKGPASSVLNGLAPRGWYTDPLGIVHIGEWPEVPLTVASEALLTRVHEDPAQGVVEFAARETLAGLLPGADISGFGVAKDVEYIYDSGNDAGLRVRCYCETGQTAGRLAAFAQIFDALDPFRKYRASYEFRVVAQAGDKFTLQPVRTGHGLPILTQVPYRPGIGGAACTVAPGSTVAVSFLDGDPARPYVSGFEPPGTAGWQPIRIDFGLAPGLGIAYQGAPVVAGPFGGTVTLGSTRAGVAP